MSRHSRRTRRLLMKLSRSRFSPAIRELVHRIAATGLRELTQPLPQLQVADKLRFSVVNFAGCA
jgi:hypothetical protein